MDGLRYPHSQTDGRTDRRGRRSRRRKTIYGNQKGGKNQKDKANCIRSAWPLL